MSSSRRSDEDLRRAGEELDEFCAAEAGLSGGFLEDLDRLSFPGLFVDHSEYSAAFFAISERQKQLGVFREWPRSSQDGREKPIEQFYHHLALQRHFLCLGSSDLATSDVRSARLTTGEQVVLVRTPERNTYIMAHWNPERYVDLNAIETIEIDAASPRRIDVTDLRLEVWIDPACMRAFVCLHSPQAKRVGIRCLRGRCLSTDLPDCSPRDDAIELIDKIDRWVPDAFIRAQRAPPLPVYVKRPLPYKNGS